jgi:hypothetical protein
MTAPCAARRGAIPPELPCKNTSGTAPFRLARPVHPSLLQPDSFLCALAVLEGIEFPLAPWADEMPPGSQEEFPFPFSLFSLVGTRSPRAGQLYYFFKGVGLLRASGCFGDQSSGGKVTRQKVGDGEENSNPISAFPDRTGPRNAT